MSRPTPTTHAPARHTSAGAQHQPTGQTFGQLTALAAEGCAPNDSSPLLRCRCACGQERTASLRHLRSGRVRACHDCARLPAFALADSISHYTLADFKREWRRWHDGFTPKQRAAFAAKLRDWSDGLRVRYVPDAVRAELVAEVMTVWLGRTLSAMEERTSR